MKKIVAIVTMLALFGVADAQNDKLDRAFNKVEKGLNKGLKEVKRLSKEVRKEVAPIVAQIKEDVEPVVNKIVEEAQKIYKKGEELAGNATARVQEAKKSLEHDVKEGIVQADEKLRREERIEAVELAIENLKDALRRNKEQVQDKAEEVIS